MFGVGIATVCNIVRQVTSAILERLHQRFVSLAGEQRLDDVMAAFKERRYPQCAGAIGATHIPVSPVALPRDRLALGHPAGSGRPQSLVSSASG